MSTDIKKKIWNAQDFGFRGNNYIMKKNLRFVSLACDTPTGPPLHLYQILSYYLKQYGSYNLHKERRKWELSLLHGTCLLVLLYISTKHYQNMSKIIKVREHTRFWLQGRQLHNEESESCISRMWHAYWSSSLFLQNIIKICLRLSKLWSA